MAGQVAGDVVVELAFVIQHRHVLGADLQLAHPRPAGLHRQLRPVLLRRQPHRRGLDPQRDVLGDQHDIPAAVREVLRHGEDPRVVVAQPETGGQRGHVGVVELDEQAPAGAQLQRGVQPAVLDAQVVEVAQRLAREVPELGMVPLALQLGDDHHRKDDLVLVEAEQRLRVREQDRGVQDVRHAWLSAHGGLPSRARYASRHVRCWSGARPTRGRDRPLATGAECTPWIGPPEADGRRRGQTLARLDGLGAVTTHTRTWQAGERSGRCTSCHRSTGQDSQEPKRRCRVVYARSARRKSTLRNSGQNASQK